MAKSGGWFRSGSFVYVDTGERFKGTPPAIKIGDPVKGVTYFDAAGRELRPA